MEGSNYDRIASSKVYDCAHDLENSIRRQDGEIK